MFFAIIFILSKSAEMYT